MAVTFLVLSALTAVSTFFAVTTPRRPTWIGFVSWAFGLLPSELPFVCLGWSAILLAVFGALGTFDTTLGIVALVLIGLAVIGQLVLAHRSAAAGRTIEGALQEGLGANYSEGIDPDLAAQFRDRVPLVPVLLKPFFSRRRDVLRVKNLAYGDAGVRNLLDVYHHRSRPAMLSRQLMRSVKNSSRRRARPRRRASRPAPGSPLRARSAS